MAPAVPLWPSSEADAAAWPTDPTVAAAASAPARPTNCRLLLSPMLPLLRWLRMSPSAELWHTGVP